MSSDRARGWDFAAMLRQRRRAAGLTQAELAARAGLAVRTLRDLERGRTTRPQRVTGVLLADALGVTGEERARFLGAARGEAPPPAVPHPRTAESPPPGGRPGRSPLPDWPEDAGGHRLRGREDDVSRLADLLTAPGEGPLALVGSAGVGKTALAGAVAGRLAGRLAGGVAWAVVEPYATTAEIAEIAELLDPAGGGARRGGRPAAVPPGLLVLDAVDRAPEEARAAISRLPPVARVLTTGQAPLGVPGERVWSVSPLAVPPAGAGGDLAAIARYPAAAVFLDRLAWVRRQAPAADELPALVGLVRGLGGVPLALELVAGHGRLLRLPEVQHRFASRIRDSADESRSVQEAVSGSYRLLCPVEQQALRWLAGFRGWWSLELAEQLLAEAGRPALNYPVPVLDRLVGLGLVRVRHDREHRFRLPDPVRDYAIELAERHGDRLPGGRAHAAIVARLVARTAGTLAGPGPAGAVERLDELAPEVWAALEYAAADDPHAALRLAATLPRWWRLRGRDLPGRQWLRRLLDDPGTADADPAVRAWAMVGLARLALAGGVSGAEQATAEAALAEFRRLRDIGGELAAASVLSAVCRAAGRYEEARAHAAAALGVATRHGRTRDAATAQISLAWHEVRRADLVAARRRLAVADRLAARAREHRLRMVIAAQLAEVGRLEGRYEEAVATGRRALAGLRELGDPRRRWRVLGTVSRSLVGLGRLAEAEQALAELCESEPSGWVPAARGVCAAAEAQLAAARGDRSRAVERWAAAAEAFRAGDERRELVESLVELAGWAERPGPVLAELERVCRAGGFLLLARERAVVDRAAAGAV
jgi:transcriptional regulator with XRE-family HTH domain/tetratricopeptide (TPR) repeat protein